MTVPDQTSWSCSFPNQWLQEDREQRSSKNRSLIEHIVPFPRTKCDPSGLVSRDPPGPIFRPWRYVQAKRCDCPWPPQTTPGPIAHPPPVRGRAIHCFVAAERSQNKHTFPAYSRSHAPFRSCFTEKLMTHDIIWYVGQHAQLMRTLSVVASAHSIAYQLCDPIC